MQLLQRFSMMLLNLYLCLVLYIPISNGDEEIARNELNGEFDTLKSSDDHHYDSDRQKLVDLLLPIPPKSHDIQANDKLEQITKNIPILTHVRLPEVKPVKVGHERNMEFIPGMNRTIRTLSVKPAIFEVKDFFDEDECELLIELAKRKKMSDLHDCDIDIIIHGAPEKTFSVWDLNGDGFIDIQEMALVPGKNIRLTEEDADDMFFMLKMDKNDDGKVDLQELIDTDLSKIQTYIEELKMMPERERKMKTTATWVWHDDDELLRFQDEFFDGYHSRIASVTNLPEEIIIESEPLQVQHFSERQFSQCRRDSDEHSDKRCCQYGESTECRLCRYISMAVFLNDVPEGGELVFPLADHEYSNIENGTGEWRGYFTYAKTTGGKNRFTIDMKIVKSGANRLILGEGNDSGGQFEIRDGIILGNTVKFQKVYISTPVQDNLISYSGKIVSGSRIIGNWWVPGKARVYGTFFMWNRNYDTLMKTSNAKCNHEEYCPRSGLVVKPERGKAIFWYNHHHNHETGMVGERNDDALHGHCAVTKGDKWLATTWLNVIGDGNDELRAWKRGINWLKSKERYPNIFSKIGSNASRDIIEDYKKEFEKFRFEETKNENKTVKHDKNSSRKKPNHVLNAVSSLLDVVDKKGLQEIANFVHKKLSLTCVPFYVEEAGKLTLKDGSKPN